jgi:uncharacterized protein YjbJ (UPF0337 family)
MTNEDIEQRSEDAPPSDLEIPTRKARVVHGAQGAVGIVRTSVGTVIERVPGTAHAARAGARRTTSALQRLPDSTLRWLTASSVGLAAGLKIAGAPRLVTAAGAAPALVMGAAIALRRSEPAVPIGEAVDTTAEGTIDMTDEHSKGAICRATGTIEEGLGTLTGDKEQQVHGKARQVQGDAQKALGDVQDVIQEPKHQEKEGA